MLAFLILKTLNEIVYVPNVPRSTLGWICCLWFKGSLSSVLRSLAKSEKIARPKGLKQGFVLEVFLNKTWLFRHALTSRAL